MLKVLVKVAPEINIKTPKIKARFLKSLVQNMEEALKASDVQYTIDERWSRLYIDLSSEEGITVLSRIFGVGSVSPIEHRSAGTMEAMKQVVETHYGEVIKDKSFCVRVKRSGAKGFTSHDAERELGAAIARHSKKVDLSNPEVKIQVEVTSEAAYFYTRKVAGPGGLPLGSQGKSLCLISGGFDSAVAAWRMMKRGVSLDFVFCNLAGAAYERSVLALVKGLCHQWSFGTRPKIHVIDFTQAVQAIQTYVNPHYSQVVLKRLFYRCASQVAKLSKANALVTGEAVGQVSSQTLSNLAAIDHISQKLILRPLISFDKEEIIDAARRIGTYVLCEHIQEYCALNNQRPVTACSVQDLDKQEAQLPQNLVESLLATTRTLKVHQLDDKDLLTHYLFTTDVGGDDTIVIDTREKYQFRAWNYPGSLHLPIQNLLAAFSKFDKSKRYVLVCQFGLQTAVVAEAMQKKGFEAYSFHKGAKELKKQQASLNSP